MGVSRFYFNLTVEYLRLPGTVANWKAIKGQVLHCNPDWLAHAPYQVKSVAIRDACLAVSASKLKCVRGNGFQTVGFKSRKNPKQSCYIPATSVLSAGVYPRLAGDLKWSENLPDIPGDSRLVCENNRWFVVVPSKYAITPAENQGRIVALDPGVRTFQTFFSPGNCGKLGNGDFGRLHRLCHHLDDLLSRTSQATARKRQRMKKAACRLRIKIRDLVTEVHHKLAKFLVENFDVILLPIFETSGMVTRSNRKLRKKSVRAMLTWSHYRFKQFLKHKAKEYGKEVVDVCEAYTSKTVSWTGELIPNLGGRKRVTSKLTNDSMDRDYNGARGIFLRALVDHPELQQQLSIRYQ